MSSIASLPDNITYHLRAVWKKLTDDEAACYESDDREFHEAVQRKYGLTREDIRRIRLLMRHDWRSSAVCPD